MCCAPGNYDTTDYNYNTTCNYATASSEQQHSISGGSGHSHHQSTSRCEIGNAIQVQRDGGLFGWIFCRR
jgi:hypothetical protein